jgi:hypothetical protein
MNPLFLIVLNALVIFVGTLVYFGPCSREHPQQSSLKVPFSAFIASLLGTLMNSWMALFFGDVFDYFNTLPCASMWGCPRNTLIAPFLSFCFLFVLTTFLLGMMFRLVTTRIMDIPYDRNLRRPILILSIIGNGLPLLLLLILFGI